MDSNLNITIRVSGRQAQAQIRAVAGEIKQMQAMVGKQMPTIAATSPWSPAIAKRQAAQAAAAASQAANAQARVIKQAATQSHRQMVASNKAATAYQMKVWRQQQAQHKAHLATVHAQQAGANKKSITQQKAHAAQMKTMGGLTPLGFAANVSKSALINAGKNINWVGRQLTYNFTLPLALAGAGLFKFTMDLEKSRTQISKVYGNIGDDVGMLEAELDALNTSFELLSSRFGVHQVEVLEIAAAWAAAGSAGSGLAENVRATLETMVLGDIDAQQAVEGLIAIQAQWGFSTARTIESAVGPVSELTLQLSYLNAIENATGISTGGLIEVIQRAGGVARTSGASLKELAAMAAALVPATGDAAQAGTALRSIISALMSPTAQATEAMELMGITVTDEAWMGAPITEKMRIMAEHFEGLSDAQQGVVSQFIATKWQVSRFDILMREIQNPLGFFNRALEVTADDTEALKIRQRELMDVLESHPKQWEIMTNVMRNTLADAFLPMIPAILSIVKFVTQLVQAFQGLSPETQKWILIGLTLLAVLGPITSMLGSVFTLVGLVGSAFKSAITPIGWFIKKALWPLTKALGEAALGLLKFAATALVSFLAAIGPIGWLIIGVIVAIVAAVLLVLHTDVEDGIWNVVKSIGDALSFIPKFFVAAFTAVWDVITKVAAAFWQLPQMFADVFMAVMRVIGRAVSAVVEALSYLNPFARHSPSLVDNVRAGVATILDEYAKLNRIPGMVMAATAALEAFSTATSAGGRSAREIELQKKADVVSTAVPQARPAANALVQQIIALEGQLPAVAAEIRNQEFVVEAWTQALKRADDQIEMLEANLSRLEDEYNEIGDAISAATSRIDELADTPIQGLQALEDQIFNNQHAQNLLNMELLEFERRGLTLDSIRDKYAEMAGEIEVLRGTQAELRGAGAGSDILGWYDQQIEAIQAQRGEMGEVEQAISDIEKRLEDLDLEQRFLDLTRAINFDPLERQIERLTEDITEMPFDEIVRQILEQQAIVRELQPQYDALGEAVERERDAVEEAKEARDGIQEQLDLEQDKLQQLEAAYNDILGLIQDMEAALNDMASAIDSLDLSEAADDASRIKEMFDAAAGLDFPDFGGEMQLGREGGLADIEEFNRLLQEELEKALAGIGDMDLFGTLQDAIDKLKDLDFLKPIKEAWDKAWEKLKGVFTGAWDWLKENFGKALMGLALVLTPFGAILGAAFYLVFFKLAPLVWGWIWQFVIAPVLSALDAGWDWIFEKWNQLWDTLIQPLIDFGVRIWEILVGAFTTAWNAVAVVFGVAWTIIQTVWDAIVGIFQWAWGIIEPIFQAIWGFLQNYIFPIFMLFAVVVEIVINVIVRILQWLWENADQVFNAIGWVINNIVVPAFEWMWARGEELFKLLGAALQWVWDNILSPIFGFIKSVIDTVVVPAFEWLWTRGEEVFGLLGTAVQWVWDNAISPVFNFIDSVIDTVVVPAFQWLWNEGERMFRGLGTALQWVWDNMIAPIWDLFRWSFEHIVQPAFEFLRDNIIKPIMEGIWMAISSVWNAVASVIETGVNFFITAFNLVGAAVNAVAGFLGIDNRVPDMDPIHIDRMDGGFEWPEMPAAGGGGAGPTVPRFAGGGIVDPSGGVYKVPMAIVGEGSRVHPEYVIPTDPRYRDRALSLMQSLGVKLMQAGGTVDGDAPSTANPVTFWGVVEGRREEGKNIVGKAIDFFLGAGKAIANGAIRAAWLAPSQLARAAINLIPNEMFKDAAQGIFNVVDQWVTHIGQDWDAKAALVIPPAAAGGGPQAPNGSGSWRVVVDWLRANNVPHIVQSTFRPGARTQVTNQVSWHALNRAVDLSGPEGMVNFSPGSQRVAAAVYGAFKSQLHELIWGGTQAYNVWNGQSHNFSAPLMRQHYNHVHVSLAEGGRMNVPRVPGGVNLNVAEGRSGEQIQILPLDESATGGTVIVINGDLSFPNVHNGNDAKNFLENLKALATQ